jgi:hypothetical protein
MVINKLQSAEVAFHSMEQIRPVLAISPIKQPVVISA